MIDSRQLASFKNRVLTPGPIVVSRDRLSILKPNSRISCEASKFDSLISKIEDQLLNVRDRSVNFERNARISYEVSAVDVSDSRYRHSQSKLQAKFEALERLFMKSESQYWI